MFPTPPLSEKGIFLQKFQTFAWSELVLKERCLAIYVVLNFDWQLIKNNKIYVFSVLRRI